MEFQLVEGGDPQVPHKWLSNRDARLHIRQHPPRDYEVYPLKPGVLRATGLNALSFPNWQNHYKLQAGLHWRPVNCRVRV